MTGINFKSVALVLAGISIALAGVMVLLFWPRRLCIDAAPASDDDGDSEFDESEDSEDRDDWDAAADSWL